MLVIRIFVRFSIPSSFPSSISTFYHCWQTPIAAKCQHLWSVFLILVFLLFLVLSTSHFSKSIIFLILSYSTSLEQGWQLLKTLNWFVRYGDVLIFCSCLFHVAWLLFSLQLLSQDEFFSRFCSLLKTSVEIKTNCPWRGPVAATMSSSGAIYARFVTNLPWIEGGCWHPSRTISLHCVRTLTSSQ